jgi:protease-4
MAACGCRKLIVNPGAIVGSIGALIGTVNAADLAKQWGIKPVIVRSDEHKARLSPLEPVEAHHLEPFQSTVETLRDSFVEVVAKGRGLEVDQVRPYADGRIFAPDAFVAAGLADQVGGWYDALDAFEFDQTPKVKRVIRRKKGWGRRLTSDVVSSLTEAASLKSQ